MSQAVPNCNALQAARRTHALMATKRLQQKAGPHPETILQQPLPSFKQMSAQIYNGTTPSALSPCINAGHLVAACRTERSNSRPHST